MVNKCVSTWDIVCMQNLMRDTKTNKTMREDPTFEIKRKKQHITCSWSSSLWKVVR